MKHSIKRIWSLLLLSLLPLLASAQTTHGDFNYDGRTSIDDVTALINYLLSDSWDDRSVPADTVEVNGVPLVMVHVDGGSYSLGEGITATVSDFSIGRTEVTEGLWCAVMGGQTNPENINNPKAGVTWEKCQEFISRLNELTGLNFRLPTKLEWGFAARGGNRSRGYLYSGSDVQDLVAWSSNMGHVVHAVALLGGNELNLYDMSGNVAEWCNDAYSSTQHWYRGGDYRTDVSHCLVTWEGGYTSSSYGWLGLRLAM